MSKQKSSDNPFGTLLQGRLTARTKPVEPLLAPSSDPDSAADSPEVTAAGTTDRANDRATAKPTPRLRARSRAQVRADRKRAKAEAEANNIPRKRGRPANGKRSDPEWIGRTYYVRKQTDVKLEDAIRKLRRSGIDVDKSQLVDALLYAWAAVELGEAADFELGDVLERPQD